MEAIRNGVKGVFSDTDWATGQPQRYGWQEVGKEKKELPKEIIQFIQRRRPPEIVNPEVRTVQDELDGLSKDVIEVSLSEKITVKKPKKEKHDNSKQKDRGTAKRKPGRMAKN